MGGTGSGRRKGDRFRPAYAPPLYQPRAQKMIQPPPKPLEYELVDLLGDDGLGDVEIEAIRVVVMFAAALRKKQKAEREQSELEATRLELGEHVATEERYADALRRISNIDGPAAQIACEALYGGDPIPLTADDERRLRGLTENTTIDRDTDRIDGDVGL